VTPKRTQGVLKGVKHLGRKGDWGSATHRKAHPLPGNVVLGHRDVSLCPIELREYISDLRVHHGAGLRDGC
jgi:hypothetical protein